MKLVAKKNGKGYETSCTISFGSREARDLHLFDKNGKLKKIKNVKSIDSNTIEIELENSEKSIDK